MVGGVAGCASRPAPEPDAVPAPAAVPMASAPAPADDHAGSPAVFERAEVHNPASDPVAPAAVASASPSPESMGGRVPERAGSISPAPAPSVRAANEYAVLIESLPRGGTVVVNGIPVGPAPRRVLLPGTPAGFSRANVSIRVRFKAEDATQRSKTVEVRLTQLDRLPSRIDFTLDGAKRVLPEEI